MKSRERAIAPGFRGRFCLVTDRGWTGKPRLQGPERDGLIGAAGRNMPGKIASRRGEGTCCNTFHHPALRSVTP